ncbi:MAG TPA: ACP phosphodiesterase [Thermoanaerobaculia bacterium]|nr:ACP phosphodiesterase [Thermoanaerobaculia bacterium]
MNYLAHLLLAEQTAESLIGNLAGDFVKGRVGDDVPPGIAAGIRHHRRVDAFTDSHPSVAAFRRVLIPEHGHYARVIADVFFDHFLAIDFTRYSSEPLNEFLTRVYATIDPHVNRLPGRLRIVYPRMRDDGWLSSYRTLEGIRLALGGISHRLSRRPQLETAVHFLEDVHRATLERLFHEFFPEVRALSPPAKPA